MLYLKIFNYAKKHVLFLSSILGPFCWQNNIFAVEASSQLQKTLPISVVTAAVEQKDIPVFLSAPATVTSKATITVKTQIAGTLQKLLFKDGQLVKSGEVIAQIDDKVYQAQWSQYKGNLEKDEAFLENAKKDLERYRKLYSQGAVSQQTYATQDSLVQQYEGIVKSDQGQLKGVEVNLGYCRIKSPVSGRIGIRLQDEGNYVQPSDSTGIAVINVLDPIDVIFSLPEENLQEIRSNLERHGSLEVSVYNPAGSLLLEQGKLTAIDNQIDSSTGTIKLRSEFKNHKNVLFPNQFVNAKLLVKKIKNAIVVPTAAVQESPTGPFVYTYESNNTVHLQKVTLGYSDGDMTVILSGLSSNQKVVTEGIDKLSEGAFVTEGLSK